jgi:hypothetical protein
MSKEILIFVIAGLVFIGVVVLWVNGIDHMNRNFPNYKAKDFFNEDEEDKDD